MARVYFVPDDARVVRYAEVVAMMAKGSMAKTVAEHFGVAPSTITRVLQRTGLRYGGLWQQPPDDHD